MVSEYENGISHAVNIREQKGSCVFWKDLARPVANTRTNGHTPMLRDGAYHKGAPVQDVLKGHGTGYALLGLGRLRQAG